ncbi:MAG: hypothetical protein V7756_07150 [Halopseudomonas sp.]|uniref:hypothetical protein n=1 Tax=Halopseudomonas sp. TaxID=2901191 RepID=UPI0030031F49
MRKLGSYSNQTYLGLASIKSDLIGFSEPDVYEYSTGLNVPDNFIICRDKEGTPTAVYDWLEWNLKPYRLGATGNCVFNFGRINAELKSEAGLAIINEAKEIMFSLMYFASSGAAGCLGVTTLYKYFLLVIKASEYCIQARVSPLVGSLKLSDLFCNPMYLAAFAKSIGSETVGERRQKQTLHALLRHLNIIGVDVLGYSVITDVVVHEKLTYHQHPLIPARIYLQAINLLTERVFFLKESTIGLELFLEQFSDPYYGLGKKVQQRARRDAGVLDYVLQPTFEEAIANYKMEILFKHHDFRANGRAKLVGVLSRIQYEMKSLIHIYTGMRFDEVNRLPYDCIIKHNLEDEVKSSSGNIVTKPECVQLLSTTTKFSGFRKEESWLAHPIVVDAVSVLQRVVRGYAAFAKLSSEECPLLVSTVKLFMKNNFPKERVEVCTFKPRAKSFESDPQFIITDEDYEILQASDPDRDFSSEVKFRVGQSWPFTAHQYRRSLAFYAANSGFVSTPSLMRQFKHLAQEMTKYYSRNNKNIKTIFGHYDFEQKAYVLPISHISYELQIGMSLDAAEAILTDLLDGGSTLHGKEGGYLEHARKRLEDGEVLVEEFKEETAKKLRNGEISYRKTFLGGCTNIDTCECSILGEFAQCLDSKCAVIKSSSIDGLIVSTQAELERYDPASAEYYATKDELESLVKFKAKKMD